MPHRSIPRKRCSENKQQIYRRTPMSKCNFNKVANNFIEITVRHGYSPVDLLHILRIPFLKNASGWFINYFTVAPYCSGYRYCTTLFNKVWAQVLRRSKCCSRHVGDLRWWAPVTLVPARNKTEQNKTERPTMTQKQSIIFNLKLFQEVPNTSNVYWPLK